MANGTVRERIATSENLQKIQRGIEAAEEAEEIIQLAKQAGLEVDAQEKRNRDARAKLLRLKQTFFPGQ